MRKKINLNEAREYIRLLKKTGIGARVHFIIGLPGEPEDIVERTLSFINESEPSSVLLSLFCPFPGTEIYNYPERFGIKYINNNWDKFVTVAARFDANEIAELVFEYNEKTPWGRGLSKERIIKNYLELQSVLRERRLNF